MKKIVSKYKAQLVLLLIVQCVIYWMYAINNNTSIEALYINTASVSLVVFILVIIYSNIVEPEKYKIIHEENKMFPFRVLKIDDPSTAEFIAAFSTFEEAQKFKSELEKRKI